MTTDHLPVPVAWRTPGHPPEDIPLGPRFPMIRMGQPDASKYLHVDPDSIEATPDGGLTFIVYEADPQPESVGEGGVPVWGPDQDPAEVGPEVTMILPGTASIGPFLLTERPVTDG